MFNEVINECKKSSWRIGSRGDHSEIMRMKDRTEERAYQETEEEPAKTNKEEWKPVEA